jgi:hypothetical protein
VKGLRHLSLQKHVCGNAQTFDHELTEEENEDDSRSFASNPNGIASFSPGLRACELPWEIVKNHLNPNGVVASLTHWNLLQNRWHNEAGAGVSAIGE